MLTRRLSCLLLPTGILMAAQDPGSLDSEACRQHLAFLDQGYSHTRSFSWGDRRKPDVIHYRFRVADPQQVVQFRFWFAAGKGNLRTRLVGPRRQTLFAQSGASGELTLSSRVPKGICGLELDVAHVVTASIKTDIRRFFESILAEPSSPATRPDPSAEPVAMHCGPP